MVCRWCRQTLAEVDDGGVIFHDLSKGPSYWADYILIFLLNQEIIEAYIMLKSFLLIY